MGVYSRELSTVDLPLDAAQSAELSDNVNSAHVLAESLPADLAASVIDVADTAFTSGMGWASAVAVGCCIATAVAVRALLPDVRAGGDDAHEVAVAERR